MVVESPEARRDAGLLNVIGVTKHFGANRVLNDVSLSVQTGERVSLIGSNGAGKTTLFNVITRLIQPDDGDVQFDAASIMGTRPHRLSALGMARTFQHSALFGSMTVAENVSIPLLVRDRVGLFKGVLRGPSFQRKARQRRDAVDEVLTRLNLTSEAGRDVAMLPFATQRRVELARSIVSRPRLLILDEPAGGLTREEVEKLEALLLEVQRGFDLSMLVIEHNMRFVMGISDYIYVLDHGQLIAAGEPGQVSQDPVVLEAYLGSTEAEARDA